MLQPSVQTNPASRPRPFLRPDQALPRHPPPAGPPPWTHCCAASRTYSQPRPGFKPTLPDSHTTNRSFAGINKRASARPARARTRRHFRRQPRRAAAAARQGGKALPGPRPQRSGPTKAALTAPRGGRAGWEWRTGCGGGGAASAAAAGSSRGRGAGERDGDGEAVRAARLAQGEDHRRRRHQHRRRHAGPEPPALRARRKMACSRIGGEKNEGEGVRQARSEERRGRFERASGSEWVGARTARRSG